MEEFDVGTTVVHRSHGVGVIKAIESRAFGMGPKRKFYIIEIDDHGCPKKVFVPLEGSALRIRAVATREAALRLVDALNAEPKGSEQTWNRRYRDYMERLASGDALQVASVVVELSALEERSFGERQMLHQAETMIKKELSAAGIEVRWCDEHSVWEVK